MQRMSLYSFLNVIFPAMAIMIIGWVTFTDVLIQQENHKYFILSLIIIYPILYLIQGVLTAIFKRNLLISLGFSILSFVITILIWANSSGLGYIVIYLLFSILGFGVVSLYQKRKRVV